MRLVDLEPEWLRHEVRVEPGTFLKPGIDPMRGNWTDDDIETRSEPTEYLIRVDSLDLAHGIRFLCPLCVSNGGHGVVCWFEGRVADDVKPGPGRWTPHGTGFDDLTFVPGQRVQAVSVALLSGCNWHGFIRNGEVTLS